MESIIAFISLPLLIISLKQKSPSCFQNVLVIDLERRETETITGPVRGREWWGGGWEKGKKIKERKTLSWIFRISLFHQNMGENCMFISSKVAIENMKFT